MKKKMQKINIVSSKQNKNHRVMLTQTVYKQVNEKKSLTVLLITFHQLRSPDHLHQCCRSSVMNIENN